MDEWWGNAPHFQRGNPSSGNGCGRPARSPAGYGMLRLDNRQQDLLSAMLPAEVLRLPPELAEVDRMLDDPQVLAPLAGVCVQGGAQRGRHGSPFFNAKPGALFSANLEQRKPRTATSPHRCAPPQPQRWPTSWRWMTRPPKTVPGNKRWPVRHRVRCRRAVVSWGTLSGARKPLGLKWCRGRDSNPHAVSGRGF